LTRGLVAASAVVGALAVTSTAAALGTTLEICGPSGCRSTAGQFSAFGHFVDLARSTLPPPVSRYYELEMKVAGARPQRGYFVPSPGKARWDITPRRVWIALRPQDVEFLTRLADGPPFDRPTPIRSFVNGHEGADPEPYAHLLDDFPPAAPGSRPVRVRLEWGKENPWDGVRLLSYSPATGVLARPMGSVQLPDGLAAQLNRDSRPAAPEHRDEGSPTTLIVIAAAAVGLLAVAVLALAARRRRRSP
jgi:MYXO-CTERM domain-containing protein